MTKPKMVTFLLAILVVWSYANSQVVIKELEYLKGEDYEKLHFKIDAFIPIPDILYPEVDNYRQIVVKIANASYTGAQNSFTFNSALIQRVDLENRGQTVEVKILLKRNVNNRIYTNSTGLIIEFPETLEAKEEQPAKKVVQPGKSKPPASNRSKGKTRFTSPAKDSISIRDFKIVESDADLIKFHFFMSGQPKYRVLPLRDPPVRLVIDLMNTRSDNINRNIEMLNVKRIRGAYNTPTIFRIVFDLDYLKGYSVSARDTILEVVFLKEHENSDPNAVAAKKEEKPAKADGKQPDVPSIKNASKQEKSLAQGGAKPADLKSKITSLFFEDEKSRIQEKGVATKEKAAQTQAVPPQLGQTIDEGAKQYFGEPWDFNFYNLPLKDFFLWIAKEAGLNVIVDGDVTGEITCELVQVPWDQALEFFLTSNGLDMLQEGNVLRIGRVETLSKEMEKRRKLSEEKELEGPLSTVLRPLNFATADKVKTILENHLSSRGKIIIDERTNQLIITDVPEKMDNIDKLIAALDTANPQVSIEARIVETSANNIESLGIQWGENMIADAAYGNQTSLRFPNSFQVAGNRLFNEQNPGLASSLGGYAINLPATAPSAGVLISMANITNTFRLDMALTAMQRKGKGKIISAPKTTTQNNVEAHVMQGEQIPVQTFQNNTIQTEYVPAALELKVKPQITNDGWIISTIDIKNNSADFANLVQGIPPIITQSINTQIRCRDGQTIVIGGMYRIEDNETIEGVPFLSKIPILGSLFRSKSTQEKQKELLIFITTRIVK